MEWFPDCGQFDHKFQEVLDHGALLLGRVTYESFAGAWPTYEGPFADRMNSMPKFVVSTTLKNPEWNNTTVLQGEAMDAVRRLKQEFDGDLLLQGSHTLLNHLKRADLVDEYRVMTFPAVLGSGFRMFDDSPDALKLKVVGTRAFGDACVETIYQRVRE